MNEHRRASDDLTEPQTMDELVRATYHKVKELGEVVNDLNVIVTKGNGKKSLCERMTIQETIVTVIAWVAATELAALGALSGWLFLFKKG